MIAFTGVPYESLQIVMLKKSNIFLHTITETLQVNLNYNRLPV